MKLKIFISVFSLFLCNPALATPVPSDTQSLVLSTEATKEKAENADNALEHNIKNPQIYSMHINANISNRFAKTVVTSKVKNVENKAAETTFSVILPENAFISEFEMEISGKIYKAYVKEKEEAKKIYQQAVSSGQSAAHVEMNARDSKKFLVSLNVEPENKPIFRLTYEELLQRRRGQYELLVNIHPGQVVEDLQVQVHINESRPLSFVKTPSLRTGNEISKNDDKLKPNAKIENVDKNSAIVTFRPSKAEQKSFAQNLGGDKENGLAGQFVVQYDVKRDPLGGEVLVKDGYFVHFFAPSELEALPKHVTFVLDHSGSMSGRKMEQLIEAMQNILSELKSQDIFNIVRFADEAVVWDVNNNYFSDIKVKSTNYGHLKNHLKESNLPEPVEASPENTAKAKVAIKDISDMGLTNIIHGLEVGIFLLKRQQEKQPNKHQPMLIFLTDGYPNVGLHSGDEITKTVTKLNSESSPKVAIFSLSFGDNADKNFLRKLSAENFGFSRHIYAASDASIQLEDFYSQISSPLLSNVSFEYVDGISQVTKIHHPFLFKGSELVVAGKIDDSNKVHHSIVAICTTGPRNFTTKSSEPVSSLERLWAYLTVKQILSERDIATNATELTKKALDLALKYSFVTPVSSLVVVKPNASDASNGAPISQSPEEEESVDAQGRVAPMPSSGVSRFASVPASGPYYSLGRSSYNRFHAYVAPRAPVAPPVPIYLRTTSRTTTIPTIITKPTIPQWLETLQNNNNNTITNSLGTFKLGHSGEIPPGLDCPNSPQNTTGFCSLIFDCPEVFPLLPDITTYLQFFCPLNEFAGICCPKRSLSPVL